MNKYEHAIALRGGYIKRLEEQLAEKASATFTTVLLDPPWPERGAGKIKRGADRHYDLITTKPDMLRTILQSGVWQPAQDSHMYMWVTDNYLGWGVWLYEALGFKLHRTLPWVKPGRMGLGQYFRGCHELLLFGTHGRGKEACKDGTFRTDYLVSAPRPLSRSHSSKPAKAYELIEARSKGPYLEMFARHTRDGWSVWGDEV